MAFEYPASVPLAQKPTPIEKLDRLSQIFEGPQIYVKRDDLTDIAMTGNKVRKLEFLLAEALQKKCDLVITCGSNQSNHARTTAIAAAKLGLKCHLVLRNSMNAPFDGNLFLNRLVGAEFQYVTPEEYMRIDDILQGVAQKLKTEGHKPYVIPEGGSNELGCIGYIQTMEEIAVQLKSLNLRIHHIIVPVGSGGTYAGMLLGKYIYDLPAKIHGIHVCDDEGYFIKKISKIIKDFNKKFELNLAISKSEISLIDGYVGKGYGLSSQEEINT
ncbi:MAG: 1-aminocyclopropane-1-carboxylate deaminase/D-cysteine desulfhydrase, partial [bacterium]